MTRESAQVANQRRKLGQRLAQFRRERGLSQRRFAELCYYDRSSIAKIENGQQAAPRRFWATADDLLSANGVLVHGFDNLAVVKAARTDDGQLNVITSGQQPSGTPVRVTEGDLERMRFDSQTFSRIDQRYGGAHVLSMLENYLARDITPALKSHPDHPDVLTVAAVFHRKAGLAAFDSGSARMAERHFHAAQQLAHRARNSAVEGHTLVSAAHHAIASGQPHAALELIDHAVTAASTSNTAGLRAKIEVMRARATAKLGDRVGCHAALNRAEHGFDRQDGSPSEWVSAVSEAYLFGQIAHCQQDLGDTRQAVKYAADARNWYPQAQVRRKVMTTCQLAVSSLSLGEIERAATLGSDALSLVDGLRSTRAMTWIHRVEGALLPHRRVPAVAEYLDAADSAVHGGGDLSTSARSKILAT